MYSIAVIQFPGTNCQEETCRALQRVGLRPRLVRWNDGGVSLSSFDGYVLPGGFSYEDRVRAGVVASRHSIMATIAEQSLSGKPVFGICNGAQILVEAGLVPGPKYKTKVALDRNSHGYLNRWVFMKNEAPVSRTAFNNFPEGHVFSLPVAHGEGRFVIEPDVFQELLRQHQLIFRYCDARGHISERFPVNPNGSFYNLAGMSNVEGNVLALMPHPERTRDGLVVFESMKRYLERAVIPPSRHDNGIPIRSGNGGISLSNVSNEDFRLCGNDRVSYYHPVHHSIQLWTQLIITDNEAETLQTTLQGMGFPGVKVRRWSYWEITLDSSAQPADSVRSIVDSGELLNTNKELFYQGQPSDRNPNEKFVLVRPKYDALGQHKKRVLHDLLNFKNIDGIRSGVVWAIEADDASFQKILQSGILAHPAAHDLQFIHSSMPHTRTDYHQQIQNQSDHMVERVDWPDFSVKRGKVRDLFMNNKTVLAVATDRLSAFDRHIATIPFKGQVLNQVSAWWFERTRSIVPNHLVDVPDPNVSVWQKCVVFPFEVVVRAYLTGSTDTAIWTQYQKGHRVFGGLTLPDGMTKNQSLPRPIITPTTKFEKHDRNISAEDIVREDMATAEEWDYIAGKALEVFRFGQQEALKHGLILVDTKYEFGRNASGTVLLIDELHTPDSSRYWLADSFEARVATGQEPDNIDKEFLRLWFASHSSPYKDSVLPQAPSELVIELSQRYIQLYEMITGQKFVFPSEDRPVIQRMRQNLQPFLHRKDEVGSSSRTSQKAEQGMAVLILGSEKDRDHARKIIEALKAFVITAEVYVASAHKEPMKVLGILEEYKNRKMIVYVTIAGRSNALSGFVAANSDFPTIACPPFADKTDMLLNIHSTLQMPSQVPVMTVLDPGNAALAVKKIFQLVRSNN